MDDSSPTRVDADLAVECTGSAEALAWAMGAVRKGGTIVQVGFSTRPRVPIDLDRLVNRELALVASRGKRPTCFEIGLSLMRTRRVLTAPLVTHCVGFGDWAEAFRIAERPGAKVVVVMAGADDTPVLVKSGHLEV
jgi:L-iditol 2-dehydrogenase